MLCIVGIQKTILCMQIATSLIVPYTRVFLVKSFKRRLPAVFETLHHSFYSWYPIVFWQKILYIYLFFFFKFCLFNSLIRKFAYKSGVPNYSWVCNDRKHREPLMYTFFGAMQIICCCSLNYESRSWDLFEKK